MKYPPGHIEDLDVDEMQILVECPYEDPGRVLRVEKPIVMKLIERRLLEQDPSSSTNAMIVRCTEDGEDARKRFSHERVKTFRKLIEDLWNKGQKEDARRLERALWKRLLVMHVIDDGSRLASAALETCEFIPG